MRMIHRSRLTTAAMLSIALLASACKNDKGLPKTNDSPNTAEVKSEQDIPQRTFGGDKMLAIQGRQIFLTYNCYGCHGGLAGGAMGPSLRDTVWKYGGTDSLIYRTLHDGRPMGMPPWAGRLTDRQIGALIEYIKSLRTKDEPQFFFAASGDTTAMPGAEAAPNKVPQIQTPGESLGGKNIVPKGN